MNANQDLWGKGRHPPYRRDDAGECEALVASIGVTRGSNALDLGCGDGTTALPAAKAEANVTGGDIARNLVEAGKRRSGAERAACRFQEGDASNLKDIKDGSFDVVASIFGGMFAPRPGASMTMLLSAHVGWHSEVQYLIRS